MIENTTTEQESFCKKIQKSKPQNYWTYEKCKEEAAKYKTVEEFRKNNSSVYTLINTHKWYDLTTHLKRKKIYWTYEMCQDISLKFTSKKQFIKNCNKAYYCIIRNGWYELMTHMTNESNINGYWTYDTCKKVALECNSKKEIKKLYSSAYNIILKNKWYELFDNMILLGNKYKRLIYVYEFGDKHFYVGLTSNIDRRNKQHTEEDYTSSVYKHIKKQNYNQN